MIGVGASIIVIGALNLSAIVCICGLMIFSAGVESLE